MWRELEEGAERGLLSRNVTLSLLDLKIGTETILDTLKLMVCSNYKTDLKKWIYIIP